MASVAPSHLNQISPPPTDDDHDDDAQRGRKRRLSSFSSVQLPSKSGALRGRGRRRSTSQGERDTLDEKHRSASPGERKSPGRKYQKKDSDLSVLQEKKKRGQSPSRSRSIGEAEGTTKPRRRQRTRSRSRNHGREKVVAKEEKGVGREEEGGVELSRE